MDDNPSAPSPEPKRNDWFPTTHWSLILAAAHSGTPHAAAALEQWCRLYSVPIANYIRRHWPRAEQVPDLAQAFFEHLHGKKYLKRADPRRGRFRCFLLTGVRRFLADQRDYETADRRDVRKTVTTDAIDDERVIGFPGDHVPDSEYDRDWACAVLDTVGQRLRDEYVRLGKGALHEELKSFLPGAANEPPAYAEIARRTASSEDAIKSAIWRLRRRWRELVRETVALTVPPEEVDEEIRYLIEILSR